MNRDHMRRLDEYRLAHAGPLENDLIDELADGGMDRQEFIKRATVLGLSVGVDRVGARGVRHAARVRRARCPRRRAAASASASRRRPRRRSSRTRSQDQGGLETGGISGEFLTRATQSLTLKPELALELEAERDRERVDVQAPPERQVRRTAQAFSADDVVTTFKRLDRPELGLAGALGVQGRPLAGRHHEGRRLHGAVHAGRADGELPVPDELDDVSGDRPPE